MSDFFESEFEPLHKIVDPSDLHSVDPNVRNRAYLNMVLYRMSVEIVLTDQRVPHAQFPDLRREIMPEDYAAYLNGTKN